MMIILYMGLIAIAHGQTSAVENATNAAPPPQGNFAVPPSQMPGPLLSFGQFLVPPKTVQLQTGFEFINNRGEDADVLVPTAIAGITERLSVAVSIPYFLSLREADRWTSGLSDPSVTAEYAIFTRETKRSTQEATVVTSLSVPIDKTSGVPAKSLGVRSYFIGATFHSMGIKWYGFFSAGQLLFQMKDNAQLGDETLLQAGLGRNLISRKNRIVFALLELNGRRLAKNRERYGFDPQSGGEIINLTPSLGLATRQLYLQLGYSFPIEQHWNNPGFKRNGLASLAIAWTFYG